MHAAPGHPHDETLSRPPDQKSLLLILLAAGTSCLSTGDDGVVLVRDDHRPMWSPDGARLAFSSERGGNVDAFVMRVDGNDEVRLTTEPVDDWYPTFSPDGQHIAFFRGEKASFDLVLLDLASGRETLPLPGAETYDGDPAWSPDGRWLAFNSDRSGNHDV